MIKNKFHLIFIALITIIALVGCSDTASKEQPKTKEQATYVITAGHAAAKEHFAQKTFEKFKELVEKNSNGKIQVEIYPASELGGEREMLEMVLLGDLTMIAPASAPLEAVSKQVAIFDLPYLFNSPATAHKVLDGEIGQGILNSLEDKGLKGLVFWENGFRHLTNNVRPVIGVSDMAGIKIRTLENPVQVKSWSLTGAEATPIAFNKLYDALDTGLVDAQETPLSLMYSMKYYEVQKYLSLTGHTYSPWPVVINKKFYDSLPAELQKVVMDAAVETRTYNRQLSIEDEKKALELLKAEGMEVTELTNEQKDQFKQAMNEIYNDVKADIGEELFNKLMQEVSN